ncbi:Rieske (2Fe-2S) protein [Pedococcus sp. 5OH_020]|uniref:Rieske (2Fe-2S) protein n=1 Tax=Pedococcus sp. 5OH_020 TaxID=2989814 RepID=UPI0022E9CDA7|nr:Rieske (2Fe-2S) protein [Pedococcus sp. 5OH_020]
MPIKPLSRRSVVRGAGLLLASAVVGFAAARSRASSVSAAGTAANAYGPSPGGQGRVVARLDQVPARGGLVVAQDKVVLVGAPGGAVRALSAVCTHQGCLLVSGPGGELECPCHGSRFDVSSGAVLSGPATSPLQAVPVTVRDGAVLLG